MRIFSNLGTQFLKLKSRFQNKEQLQKSRIWIFNSKTMDMGMGKIHISISLSSS